MVVCCEIEGRGTCIQLSLVSVLLLVFVSPFSSSREFSGFPPHLIPYQSVHSFLVKLGTRTQKKFTPFLLLLWGMIEMLWLQYTQSLNLYQIISCKITKKVYTCEKSKSCVF